MTRNKMSEIDLTNTTDASIWAAQFIDLFGNKKVEEGLMLSWFANALEAGRREGLTTIKKQILLALNEIGIPTDGYPTPIANAENILREALRLG